MKKLFILILAGILISGITKSQDPYFSQWSEEIVANANTAHETDYLNDTEKEIIYLMNLARADGKLFATTYLKKYADENEFDTDNANYSSLVEDLNGTKNLPMLAPDKDLFRAAEFHADDTGKAGIIGHNSSDGTSFSKRLHRFTSAGAIAENCDYGLSSALSIVCDLLIDEGVASLGHRKNILGSYNRTGVALRQHITWSYICVMDFAISAK
jgi:hypothetical protein